MRKVSLSGVMCKYKHMLRLAREHRITIYDALYIELAIRKQKQLATLDHALRQAAEAEGIDIL